MRFKNINFNIILIITIIQMSFLCVVVDCNPANWGAFLENENGAETFQHVISAIVAFCNAHIVSSLNNRLLLLAGGVKGPKKKLFSTLNYAGNVDVVHEIDQRLRAVLSEMASDTKNVSSSSCYAAAVSLGICAFQRYKRETIDSTGRIVIINLTKDLAAEQNMLMNLFFSANQQLLEVNVAALNDAAVPILQQACDITSGTHMLISKSKTLMQHLMQYCLATSAECKEMFAVRHEEDVDYRASCHCHSRLVDIGWVCSVCLSVHCQFFPICTTCNVLFSLAPNQKNARRRKNNNLSILLGGTGANGK